MLINVYVNNNGTFTVNAFDNDGYLAGALSKANDGVDAKAVVEFIDELRNKEPENVQARVLMGGATEDIKLNLLSSKADLHMSLVLSAQTVQNVLVGV